MYWSTDAIQMFTEESSRRSSHVYIQLWWKGVEVTPFHFGDWFWHVQEHCITNDCRCDRPVPTTSVLQSQHSPMYWIYISKVSSEDSATTNRACVTKVVVSFESFKFVVRLFPLNISDVKTEVETALWQPWSSAQNVLNFPFWDFQTVTCNLYVIIWIFTTRTFISCRVNILLS